MATSPIPALHLDLGDTLGAFLVAVIIVSWSVHAGLSTIAHLFYAAQVYQLSNKRGWWICTIVMIPKPKGLLYIAIFEIAGNLYSNSILSMLNSRRFHAQARLPVTTSISTLGFATVRNLNTIGSMHTADNYTTNIIKVEISDMKVKSIQNKDK
ncbi:hypothetical protein WG66_010625 [Moniliophthora roreri]|nr:hypothetical protein WG66_010625 [Moniliophthora roreri]